MLKYLLIGFIDGDGNIHKNYKRNDCTIRIKLHKSWLNILKEFCEIIGYKKDCAKVNNNGYASLVISNSIFIIELKKLSKNVPALNRKWEIIDENFVSRYITSKIIKESVLDLLNKNVKKTDIAKELGISPACVTKISKINK